MQNRRKIIDPQRGVHTGRSAIRSFGPFDEDWTLAEEQRRPFNFVYIHTHIEQPAEKFKCNGYSKHLSHHVWRENNIYVIIVRNRIEARYSCATRTKQNKIRREKGKEGERRKRTD